MVAGKGLTKAQDANGCRQRFDEGPRRNAMGVILKGVRVSSVSGLLTVTLNPRILTKAQAEVSESKVAVRKN